MNLRQTIRASPRFPKPAPNLDFLASLKKTTLQQFHILTQSFHTWEKDPAAQKYMHAYRSVNLKVKGCGEE